MSILTRFDDDDDDKTLTQDPTTIMASTETDTHTHDTKMKKNFINIYVGKKCVHVAMQCDVQATTTTTKTTTVCDRMDGTQK